MQANQLSAWTGTRYLTNGFKLRRYFALLILVFVSLYVIPWGPVELPRKSEVPKSRPAEIFNSSYLTYTVNNETVCREPALAGSPILLVLVSSARQNFEFRQVIRETWGSVHWHEGRDRAGVTLTWNVRLIFLVGLGPWTEGPGLARLLQEESMTFGDIVGGSFLDTYRNLTYKHLLGYRWALDFCPSARLVLKADDDVYVNMQALIQVISSFQRKSAMLCSMSVLQPAVRGPEYKTPVTVEEFPWSYFPTYCSGFGYLVPVSVISALYALREEVRFLYIEDVFVTGLLRQAHNRRNNETYIHIVHLAEPRVRVYYGQGIERNYGWNQLIMISVEEKDLVVRLMCYAWRKNFDTFYGDEVGRKRAGIRAGRVDICPKFRFSQSQSLENDSLSH